MTNNIYNSKLFSKLSMLKNLNDNDKLASRTFFNEASQISEHHSAQMQAVTTQKIGQF